ncbi:MAG: PEP-CTERM sorting domain-containing protein [Verrucomicrobiaceae bacterium]|nr:MAG: PEP-CTERM sorting domain-containing protein [Verrucomicrobiaceae bacterium]
MKKTFLLIASGICCLAASSHAALIAHYKFDELTGSSAIDELGGTSGLIGSGVVIGQTGIGGGNAYLFPDAATQAGIVDMGNASFFSGANGLNSSTQVTYSVWMNSTDSDANRNTVLYSGSDTVANSYQDIGMSGEVNATINSADGAASARNRPAGATIPQQTGVFSSPTTLHDGNWHHLALTVDLTTATMVLYVDGVASATQSFGTATVLFPVFNNFEIGRLGRTGGSGATDAFGGLIDDVQVYNTALAAQDVLYLFQNPGESVPEPSVIAFAGLGLLSLAFRRRG